MIYVDNVRLPYKRMKMCHMIADTSEELLAMGDKLGLKRAWLQHKGTYREHFDISLSVRARAIELGVVEVDRRTFVRVLKDKRRKLTQGNPHYDYRSLRTKPTLR